MPESFDPVVSTATTDRTETTSTDGNLADRTTRDRLDGMANELGAVAVPVDLGLGVTAPTATEDRAFLMGDYANNRLNVSSTIPTRSNPNRRIAIVYSETSASNFFDKKAYNQLFATAQSQAISAGIPFDLITESDLKNLDKLVNYDALVFPSFAHVNKADLSAIENSLTQAIAKYGIGTIAAGEFMTNDENGAAFDDPYSRMRNLLGIQRTAGGGIANAVVNVRDANNNILAPGYTPDEQLVNYDTGTAFAAYSPIAPATILATQIVSGENYNAIVATQTSGQNIHFANQSIFADSKIVAQAIESIVYKDKVRVSLDITRNASLFLSRDDVDQSRFLTVAPVVESKLADILTDWKNKYGFVGTHFINIGNDPAKGEATDWNVMKPIYQRWLTLGNEIGTHSYTHPDNPSNLTPTQTEFEFDRSRDIINQQLGINITGAATPGNPDSLTLDKQIDNYFQYYTGVGTAYNSAFGFLDPTAKAISFAPNISFDYNAIDFRKLTTAQTAALWNAEYNQLSNHAHKPIIEFAWHDYGVTGTDPAYSPAIYEDFIAKAAGDGTEFITFDDAQNRLRTFKESAVAIDQIGNTITARVTPNSSTAGVGKFSLDIQSARQIQNVNDYYAFDNDSVFLTKNGGNYTINLGTTTDKVTHIVSLAQRAELLSVTGDGQNLDYTFNGEGTISIDLNIPAEAGIIATGADNYTLVGNRLEMNFDRATTHTASVRIAPASTIQGSNRNDLLTGGNANSTIVGVDPLTPTVGKGEIDTLTLADSRDRFILGDTDRVYYNDGNSTSSGLNDYAKIVGFAATAGDVIQLGNAADDVLSNAPTGVTGGTAIYNNLFGEPELISIVENGSGLSLTDPYFTYV
jgi:serralysin